MKETFLIDLGQRLQAVRRALNLQQRDMANVAGLAPSYLSELENGNRTNPGIAFIHKISKAYNVSLDYLINGIGDMFLSDTGRERDIDTEKFPDFNTPKDMIWLSQQSSFFKNLLLGMAHKIYFENAAIIKDELKRSRERIDKQEDHSPGKS